MLVQSAFQAGPLRTSLPVLMAVEPAAGVVVGLWLFHERVAWRGWAGPLELAAVLLVAGASRWSPVRPPSSRCRLRAQRHDGSVSNGVTA